MPCKFARVGREQLTRLFCPEVKPQASERPGKTPRRFVTQHYAKNLCAIH